VKNKSLKCEFRIKWTSLRGFRSSEFRKWFKGSKRVICEMWTLNKVGPTWRSSEFRVRKRGHAPNIENARFLKSEQNGKRSKSKHQSWRPIGWWRFTHDTKQRRPIKRLRGTWDMIQQCLFALASNSTVKRSLGRPKSKEEKPLQWAQAKGHDGFSYDWVPITTCRNWSACVYFLTRKLPCCSRRCQGSLAGYHRSNDGRNSNFLG